MVHPIISHTNDHAQTFEAFLERWLIDQERYLRDLLGLMERNRSEEEEYEVRCKGLIEQIMGHYKHYFEAKARVIEENVFLVLMPTWFSSFERAYLWIGGFRPGLLFRLVKNNVLDLTEEQSQRISRLMAEIKEEEKELTDEFDRAQEVVASPPMVELVRRLGRLRNGAEQNIESAVDRLKLSLATLAECADFLRMKTGIMLVEILKPPQAIRLLAAVAQLQLRVRRWGMQRDGQNRMHNAIFSDIENRAV
ncbi:UNVERIFIED_CONTAM: protein RESPONSE TO ABA AND SALT 1 [Sesamum radiatum]|uniref:Protein RESPONSE TO ABA AND SALT 1 n=1 Tax=Sesamum radiatum TaxID=300843 RepID=A0AAW2LK91_SESRA